MCGVPLCPCALAPWCPQPSIHPLTASGEKQRGRGSGLDRPSLQYCNVLPTVGFVNSVLCCVVLCGVWLESKWQ